MSGGFVASHITINIVHIIVEDSTHNIIGAFSTTCEVCTPPDTN